MEKGSYKGRRVNLSSYTASLFHPHLFASPTRALAGCGATALALITGTRPELISKARKGQRHFSDEFMVGFLRRRGYSVTQLTLCNLSTSEEPIGRAHVVLLSQLLKENEATWGVLYMHNYFHNFKIYDLEALSLLNRPVLSAYVLMHPGWQIPPPQ